MSTSRARSSRRTSPAAPSSAPRSGPARPGSAYVLLHHYMGDIDGTVGAWGFARGGMGAITQALGASLRGAAAASIRSEAPVAQILTRKGGAQRGGARGRRGDQRPAGRVEPRRAAHVSRRPWIAKDLPPEFLAAGAATSRSAAPRASSTSRSTACRSFPAIPTGCALHARRHARHRHDRNDRARLRRLEGRPLVAARLTSTC